MVVLRSSGQSELPRGWPGIQQQVGGDELGGGGSPHDAGCADRGSERLSASSECRSITLRAQLIA